MLVILVLAVPAFMAIAVAAGLAIVIVLVRREDRHMSLRLRPVSRVEATGPARLAGGSVPVVRVPARRHDRRARDPARADRHRPVAHRPLVPPADRRS